MRPLVVVLALMTLCACGLKDDLYLPEPEKKSEVSNAAGQAEPAAEERDDTGRRKDPNPPAR